MIGVEVEGQPLAVYHLEGGEFCATDNICTHEYACLSEGWLEDGFIECPLHAGRFDVRTGRQMGPPLEKDIRTFPVKIDGEDVLVDLASPSEVG